jgi:hypothetical protein
MDCEEQRKAYRECFMVRSDCRKELDNIFKCSYEKNYYFPINPESKKINQNKVSLPSGDSIPHSLGYAPRS